MRIIITLLLTAFITVSCSDFIDQDLRGKQDLDNYFRTTTECQDFVNDIYKKSYYLDSWYQLIGPRFMNEMASDDAWMGNTSQSAGNFIPAAHYLITPQTMGLTNYVYRTRYETIMSCNIAIANLPQAPISAGQVDRNMGETLFFRALNYYELVINFGGMPIVDVALTSSDMNKERASIAETYTFIEKDLLDAADKLENISYDASDKGRITKWACYALLARVSLFQGKWDAAHLYANKVITEGRFRLEPNFVDIWSVNNPNGMESILEAQSNPTSDKNLGNQMSTLSGARGENKDNFPSNNSNDVMDGWGWCTPTSDLENCYISENDKIRRRSTITVNGEAAYGDDVLNPTHVFDLTQNKSGRIIRKFYIPIATRRLLSNKSGNAPLNAPIIRLAEMYLTRAEAAYHLKKSADEVLADIDVLRARVDLTPKKGTLTGTKVLRAVWKERRMELAFEGVRLFDIRRQIDPDTNLPVIASILGPNGTFVEYNIKQSTDQFETKNKGELQDKGINFDMSKHLLWPLPQAEIDKSQGKIQQNPNY